MNKIIRVTGKGKLSLKPDLTIITMNMSNTLKDYEMAINESNEKVRELKDAFEKIGFKRSDLKTHNFTIDTSYKSYRKGDDYYQRFEGYEYNETLVLEFDANNETLAKVLSAITKSKANPKFHIQYSVKDTESAKNELLALSVKDSRSKAEIIAMAAGLKLKEVESIDYSWKEVDFISRRNYEFKCDYVDIGSSVDMEPEDIDVSESVTITYIAE